MDIFTLEIQCALTGKSGLINVINNHLREKLRKRPGRGGGLV